MLRSALSYISQASSTLINTGVNEQHPYIGQNVEIGGRQYLLKSLLAEGGFALVFMVEDLKSCEKFALKRQLAIDKLAASAVIREIKFNKQLSGHPAIVQFIHATQLDPDRKSGHFAEFFILTELCAGGPLINYLQKTQFSIPQICRIFNAVTSAVLHMHDRNPPITHRDIKIENLLLDSKGYIKLCDFGSATTDIYRPDTDWNAFMRSELEEEMTKYTTPMYRAPEILDTYQNYPIGPAQDIWALGCVLYYLCYNVHPFEDSAKLRILNANYKLSAQSQFHVFHDLIRNTLQPDPYSRPTVQDLSEQVHDLANQLNVNLDEPIVRPNEINSVIEQFPASSVPESQTIIIASQIKDQGISLLKSIKAKSSISNISEQFKAHLGFDWDSSSKTHSNDCSANTDLSQQTIDEKRDFQNKNIVNEITDDFLTSLNWSTEKEKKLAGSEGDDEQPTDMHSDFTRENDQSLVNETTTNSSHDANLLNLLDVEIPHNQNNLNRIMSSPNFTAKSNDNEHERNKFDDEFHNFISNKNFDAQYSSENEICYEKPNYFAEGSSEPTEKSTKSSNLNVNAFDDLLTSQGFASSSTNSNKTLLDLMREKDVSKCDPLVIKIKDWTNGKERNIRALLGSLSDILWAEAKRNWDQPSIAELFDSSKIKKHYRKACLIVHPDKEMGTDKEHLARAIFTELNDAWNEFLKTN